MDYADSLRQVLVRKITKAERDLDQLKLDYCRFVFGISHRSQVRVGSEVYLVRAVDVATMDRLEGGEFGKPAISGVLVEAGGRVNDAAQVELGTDWEAIPQSAGLRVR